MSSARSIMFCLSVPRVVPFRGQVRANGDPPVPAGVDGEFGAVLDRLQDDRRGLHPQREALRCERDDEAAIRNREDA